MNSLRIVGGALVVALLVVGCGDDDSSNVDPTPTVPPIGPEVTFVGVTRADDSLVQPVGTRPDGVPIYARTAGAVGGASGFRLVVEGKKGRSGVAVAISTLNENVSQLPDLQIQTNRALGNGSSAVCDTVQPTPGPAAGGVPAVDPPRFDGTVSNANSINDLACRFRDGQGQPTGISNSADGCVKIEPTEDYGFVNSESEVQFCGFVSAILAFPQGDTLLTVRLRDQAGNVGAPAQMIIRVN